MVQCYSFLHTDVITFLRLVCDIDLVCLTASLKLMESWKALFSGDGLLSRGLFSDLAWSREALGAWLEQYTLVVV